MSTDPGVLLTVLPTVPQSLHALLIGGPAVVMLVDYLSRSSTRIALIWAISRSSESSLS